MTSTTLDYGSTPPPRSRLSWTYWLCNIIETWERLAYYTWVPMIAIYVASATEPGGLRLTQAERGQIVFVFSLISSILPMVTGGYADRYGYKLTVAFALTVNLIGYLIMATVHTYFGFFTGVVVVGIGTAFFKPGLQGTLAHILTKETSSMGWGIFYWVVNVGAFTGHLISPLLLGTPHSPAGWKMLYLGCAAFTGLNLLTLIRFPNLPTGADTSRSPLEVFAHTIVNVLEVRLIAWLLIMAGFWMMMYQLWDLMPNFIEEWVDSSWLASHAPFASWQELGPDGRLRVPQQIILSLNSFMIVALIIPVSWVVRKMRTLEAMFFGMLGATAGVLLAGITRHWWMLGLGIVCFSLGEMLTGPKKSEYLGLIAPPGKKGLYLGYVNIPVGIGRALGGKLSAFLYGHYGDRANLSLRYLLEHTPLGKDKQWDGDVTSLEKVLDITRTNAFAKLQEVTGKTGAEVSQLLWDTYDPYLYTWVPFAAIGVISAIALAIFGRMAKRWSDMNA